MNDRQRSFSQLRKGVLEFCVLASLDDVERYGFEIVRMLSEANMVISEGTIYPLLGRLRREGMVDTTWRESTSGPPRRYYRLTKTGQRALKSFVEEWTEFRTRVDDLLRIGVPE